MRIKAAAQAMASAAGLASLAQAAHFPPDIPGSSTLLGVDYGNPRIIIQPGQTLPFSQRSFKAPIIGLEQPLSTPGPYLVTMIDPDAPTPSNTSLSQIIHWLQPGLSLAPAPAGVESPFPFLFTAHAPAVATFMPPAPPPGSPPHHYIQLLWQQPADFSVPAAFSGFGGENRTNFDIVAFARAAGLQGPLAANFWLTSMGFHTGNTTSPGAMPTGTMPGTGPTGSPPPFQGGAAAMVPGAGIWAICIAALVALL